ncbi:MAG: LacI family DNA-binding transcriptional regulator [Lentisphaeria bacterium]|nr:LacI family DNA-binding transcriptional regulator [Lentisphaeria bacterium]
MSTATISRILNGKGAHKPETIARVRRVVSTLSTRGVVGMDRECVGIVLLAYPRFLCEEYTSSMLSAMIEALNGEGMLAQIIPVNGAPLMLEDAELLVDKFNLRGMLVQELGCLDRATGPLGKLPVPVVRVGDVRDGDCRNIVYCDNRQLGANAAAYLWNLGFRDFGVVYSGNGDYGQERRMTGFVEQIRRFGGDADRIWLNPVPHTSLESAITSYVDFMKLDSRPGALFFALGGLTRMFLVQARRGKTAVPQELFILAVEDAGEFSDAELPIATISFPTRELGSSAASMLADLIRNGGRSSVPERRVNCDSQIRVGPACLMAGKTGN